MLRSVQSRQVVEVDFFLKVILDQEDLENAREVRIQFVHNGINFFIRIPLLFGDDIHEVLSESIPSAKLISFSLFQGVRVSRKEVNVETVHSDVICKLLNTLFRPSLHSAEEFSRVLLLKFCDALLELYLSSSQWMDLHEFEEVEKGF